MPRYDYACIECSIELEIFHGFNDPTPACPECEEPLKKRIASVPAIFNGPGFFSTDNRRR